jgi:hypothetical protein
MHFVDIGEDAHAPEVDDPGDALSRHALALAREDLRDQAVQRRAHQHLLTVHPRGLELGIASRGQGDLPLNESVQFPNRSISKEDNHV